jgi:tRNA(fMet)-specific endonuclease VapC
MKYLLDTNICINFINGTSDKVREKLKSIPFSDIVLCSIVKAELYYGVSKSKRRTDNLNKLSEFFSFFDSYNFDDNCSSVYGEIRADLEVKGSIIGPYDMLIASICIANNLILVTNNISEFSRVKELRYEDWTE